MRIPGRGGCDGAGEGGAGGVRRIGVKFGP